MNPIEAFIRAEYFYTYNSNTYKKFDTSFLSAFENKVHSISEETIDLILSNEEDVISEFSERYKWRVEVNKLASHNKKLWDRFEREYIQMLKSFNADVHKKKGELKNVYRHLIDDFRGYYNKNYQRGAFQMPYSISIITKDIGNVNVSNSGNYTKPIQWAKVVKSKLDKIRLEKYKENRSFSKFIIFCHRNGINHDNCASMNISDFRKSVEDTYYDTLKLNLIYLKTKVKFHDCPCGSAFVHETHCSCGKVETEVHFNQTITYSSFRNAVELEDYDNLPKLRATIKKLDSFKN